MRGIVYSSLFCIILWTLVALLFFAINADCGDTHFGSRTGEVYRVTVDATAGMSETTTYPSFTDSTWALPITETQASFAGSGLTTYEVDSGDKYILAYLPNGWTLTHSTITACSLVIQTDASPTYDSDNISLEIYLDGRPSTAADIAGSFYIETTNIADEDFSPRDIYKVSWRTWATVAPVNLGTTTLYDAANDLLLRTVPRTGAAYNANCCPGLDRGDDWQWSDLTTGAWHYREFYTACHESCNIEIAISFADTLDINIDDFEVWQMEWGNPITVRPACQAIPRGFFGLDYFKGYGAPTDADIADSLEAYICPGGDHKDSTDITLRLWCADADVSGTGYFDVPQQVTFANDIACDVELVLYAKTTQDLDYATYAVNLLDYIKTNLSAYGTRVRRLEIGNECWGTYPADSFAVLYDEIVDDVQTNYAVDFPNLSYGFNALIQGAPIEQWTKTVMDSISETNNQFIGFHYYPMPTNSNMKLKQSYDVSAMKAEALRSNLTGLDLCDFYKRMMVRTGWTEANHHLVVSEQMYNHGSVSANNYAGMHAQKMVGACAYVDYLIECLRNIPHDMQMANMRSLRARTETTSTSGGALIHAVGDNYHVTPRLKAFALFTRVDTDLLCSTIITRDAENHRHNIPFKDVTPFNTQCDDDTSSAAYDFSSPFIPNVDNTPALNAVGIKNTAGDTLYIFAVNKDSVMVTTEIDVDNLTVSTAEVRWLGKGNVLSDDNSATWNNVHYIDESYPTVNNEFRFVMPGPSIARVKLYN